MWCKDSNLSLNVIKTKKMILDYRKRRTENAPILIDRAVVEQVESIHITSKRTWSKHTKTVMKRTQQNLFLLRRLKRFGMGPQILKRFYSCTTKSILAGCITAWYGNCSVFRLHGKWYRSTKSRSKRLSNSFYLKAIRLLNS